MRTLCGTILAALLPVAVCAATYKVDIDRSDGLYRCGETATFTVRVLSTNALAGAANPYAMLDNFGSSVLTNMPFDVTVTGVAFTVSGTLSEPGFLRLSLPPTKSGRDDPYVFSVGFEPEKIRKGSPSPDDFDAFWAAARARLASEVPIDAQAVKEKLVSVADSPRYYWAWTYPWLNHGGWNGDMRNVVEKDGEFLPKPLDEVKLECEYQKCAGGRRAVLNYADLASLVGTWHSDRYYKVNRAGMTAAIKKQWHDFGGVMVFNWHMDHPYCTNGFRAASYRFKSDGENRNVIRQILDGTGVPCGTGAIDGKSYRQPFANPREWYMASLKDVADFFSGLVDEKTGKKIPVILRYPHEMDGNWFWWGRGWCTTEEFRRFCRMEADYLRKKCPRQILFAYTPDRTWKNLGNEGDANNTFLAYYPGDRYVDILGIDDYSIGHGDDTKAEAALAETVRKLRLMTSFAKERRQVVCISESGGQKKRKDFWTYLHRAATAEGVNCAFVNTWAGEWGTRPETPEEAADQRAFAARAEVLMEGAETGLR